MSETKKAATFTTDVNPKGEPVVTMADLRAAVYHVTKTYGGVVVAQGKVMQSGEFIGRVEGEVVGA